MDAARGEEGCRQQWFQPGWNRHYLLFSNPGGVDRIRRCLVSEKGEMGMQLKQNGYGILESLSCKRICFL